MYSILNLTLNLNLNLSSSPQTQQRRPHHPGCFGTQTGLAK
jgi:hypothetical protein